MAAIGDDMGLARAQAQAQAQAAAAAVALQYWCGGAIWRGIKFREALERSSWHGPGVLLHLASHFFVVHFLPLQEENVR